MRLTKKQRQAVTAATVQRYRNGCKKITQQILNEFYETTFAGVMHALSSVMITLF